jgi:signal transduction histidine kinase
MPRKGRGESIPSTFDTTRRSRDLSSSIASCDQKITVSPLSIDDFRLLVHSSSAAIGCFELLHPVDTRIGTTDFVSAVYGHESVCMEANEILLEMLQEREVESILGASIAELLPESRDWPKLFSVWHQASLSPMPLELVLRQQDGSSWSASCAVYGMLSGHYLRRIWLVVRDISRYAATLRTLTDTERHYRSILNTPNTLSIRYLPCGLCEYVSPSTVCMLGLLESERFQRPIYLQDFVHPTDVPLLLAPFSQQATPGGCEQISVRCRGRDGTFIEFNARAFKAPQAEISVIAHDLVGQRVNDADSVSNHSAQLTQATACVIHDLNNLLTAALAHTTRASREVDSPEFSAIQRTLELCATLSKRVANMEGEGQEQVATISLNRALEQSTALIRPLLGPGITLTASQTTNTPLYVAATYADVAQILSNLILNAQEALKSAGTIKIEIDLIGGPTTETSVAALTVSDNGPGIDPLLLPRLFQQPVSSKLDSAGHGLGLLSVKTIVDRLRGTVEVNSDSGGTIFRVYLPLDKSPEARDLVAPTRTDSALSIVIADDEPLIRDMFTNILSEMGHSITTAADGRSLLKTLESAPNVDLVILDDQMPSSRATDLAAQLHFQRPGLSIIVASGDPSLRQRMRTVSTNVSFLDKPFTRSEIEAALRAVPRRRALPLES